MSDNSRQRAVQKEAVLEVLTESLKDLEYQQTKQELQELAYELENQAFLCSNSEINKEYRGKLNGIKVKLKGEKGSFLRGVLLDGIFTPKDFMILDINQVNDDKIELLLKSRGVTFDRSKYKNNKSPSKIPLPKINVKSNQGQEIQSVLQEQLMSEVLQENLFEEIQWIPQRNEKHYDNQIQSNILSSNSVADDNQEQIELIDEFQQQTQKDQLEYELQNKLEDNKSEQEQQNIINIYQNQKKIEQQCQHQEEIVQENNNTSQSNDLIESEKANYEVKENLQNVDKNIDKNNFGDQDPDVDLSQHKICEHLLTNMESNKFAAFPSQNDEQINDTQSLKLKNKELEILVNFLKEELNKQQKYNQQLIINQKQIYQAEIDQLKQQLQLAKTTYQITTEQVEINQSFQDRQDILRQLFLQFQQQFSASNVSHTENQKQQEIPLQHNTILQEQNLEQSIQFYKFQLNIHKILFQCPRLNRFLKKVSKNNQKKFKEQEGIKNSRKQCLDHYLIDNQKKLMDNILCNNCGKYINNNQFLLHEAYCERSIIQCKICDQNYDQNQYEIHDEEFHKKCSFCGQISSVCINNIVILERLKEHEANCNKKLEPCEYCKLPVSQIEWYQHRQICECKTNNCTFCDKIIVNKHIRAHELECFQKITFANMISKKNQIQQQKLTQQIAEEEDQNYENDEDLDDYYEQIHNYNSEQLE